MRHASILLVGAVSINAFAQWWYPVGNGFLGPGGPACIYADPGSGDLLVGGSFLYAMNGWDSVLTIGMAKWDGAGWDSLAHRVYPWEGPPSNVCQNTYSFQRINGTLYANGGWAFLTSDSSVNRGIARLDEDSLRWGALECPLPPMGGIMHLLYVTGDTMFLTGYPGSVCGEAPTCVYSYYNGIIQRWAPFDDWPEHESNYVSWVFPFQGQYYMTGLLNDTANSAFYGFLRYTGSEWEPVPGFEVYGPIKKVLIHDNKLYVCGQFFEPNGQPGNMVASFDGTQWNNLGGGLLYSLTAPTSGNPIAVDMFFDGDTLYVSGQFKYAGGIPAQNIAKWNGVQWCSLYGIFDDYYTLRATMWNNQVYVVGGFQAIDSVPMRQVARYLGGYQVENCSSPIGIGEDPDPDTTVQIIYDPSTSSISFAPFHSSTLPLYHLQVFDPLGRLLLARDVRPSEPVSVAALASGAYVARVSTAQTVLGVGRFVKH